MLFMWVFFFLCFFCFETSIQAFRDTTGCMCLRVHARASNHVIVNGTINLAVIKGNAEIDHIHTITSKEHPANCILGALYITNSHL